MSRWAGPGKLELEHGHLRKGGGFEWRCIGRDGTRVLPEGVLLLETEQGEERRAGGRAAETQRTSQEQGAEAERS